MRRNIHLFSVVLGIHMTLCLFPLHIPFLAASFMGFFSFGLTFFQIIFLEIIEGLIYLTKQGQYMFGFYTMFFGNYELALLTMIIWILMFPIIGFTVTMAVRFILKKRHPEFARYMSAFKRKSQQEKRMMDA